MNMEITSIVSHTCPGVVHTVISVNMELIYNQCTSTGNH